MQFSTRSYCWIGSCLRCSVSAHIMHAHVLLLLCAAVLVNRSGLKCLKQDLTKLRY
jgi:hypothetical protein